MFHFSFSSEFVRNGSSFGKLTVSSTLEGRSRKGGQREGGREGGRVGGGGGGMEGASDEGGKVNKSRKVTSTGSSLILSS